MRRLCIALVCAALFAACSSTSVVYLVTDVATAASMGGEAGLRDMLRSAVESRRLSARVLVAAADGEVAPAMDTAVNDGRTALVVCLTAVPLDLTPWATEHPTILFAGYGSESGAPAPNWLRLVPERTEAYREAGRRVSSVSMGDPLGGRVAVLAASPTGVGTMEIQAFREGVVQAGGQDPLYSEVRSLTDKAAAVRALRELRGRGARFFLLKTYALTSACLEVLEQEGDRAVVEDCGIQGSCGSPVILSIETDWTRTLAGVVAGMGEGRWNLRTAPESWTLREGAPAVHVPRTAPEGAASP